MANEIERPDLLPYASEKLAEAVHVLATHPGDVKSRLRSTFESLRMVPPSGLPARLRQEYESIWHDLTKRPSEEPGLNPFSSTLRRMRLKTASKLAERIFSLNAEVHNLHE